jgi:hypothetical protein
VLARVRAQPCWGCQAQLAPSRALSSSAAPLRRTTARCCCAWRWPSGRAPTPSWTASPSAPAARPASTTAGAAAALARSTPSPRAARRVAPAAVASRGRGPGGLPAPCTEARLLQEHSGGGSGRAVRHRRMNGSAAMIGV